MQTIRCAACSKMLAKGLFERMQIKCGRCRTVNDVRALSPQPERQGAPDPVEDGHANCRQRADKGQANAQ